MGRDNANVYVYQECGSVMSQGKVLIVNYGKITRFNSITTKQNIIGPFKVV